VGQAAGDALGAPYEFESARIHGEQVAMVGGGAFGWAVGEWTDDTSMAICIAEVSAQGIDLRDPAGLDEIVGRFVDWAGAARDIGNQTSAVLRSTRVRSERTGSAATQLAAEIFAQGGSAGNGSLMRTSPVALAYLHDPDGRRAAARAVSALTHPGEDAEDATQIWCDAIAHAVLHGTLDGVRLGVDSLPPARASLWHQRLDEAEAVQPHEIPHNGWVVAALQAAWSAIHHAHADIESVADPRTFASALEAAVRCGGDTDTVAAIAGGLLGARWGVTAIPLQWQRVLHGWPGYRTRDLISLGLLSATSGICDPQGWPKAEVFDYSSYSGIFALAEHPHDPDVVLGGVQSLRSLPDGVDAIVSLCRLGATEHAPAPVAPKDHVEVWLIDSAGGNQHTEFVLREAADAVAALRSEGKRVLLHCVQAQSRTPSVAALYSARHLGVDPQEAMTDVCHALPDAHPQREFLAAIMT
jgi:ADP-ribosylglycohydrolase